MHFDWTIPAGTMLLILGQIVGGVWIVSRSLHALEKAFDERFADFALLLNTFKEGDLRELKNSVKRLESGQDEWTQTLRTRTHSLGETTQTLVLKVDRLEQRAQIVDRIEAKP